MKYRQANPNCPTYYIGAYHGIEAMDVVMDFSHDNYNIATALTYLMRAGKKPNNPMSQDIEKAIAHLQRELEHQRMIEENLETYYKRFENAG
jgi:hypothetical protein